MEKDWSIQEVARLAGTTSRTLRHYDEIGLLEPSRVTANGYRHYDERALLRLQRILLLRDLGVGLPAIGEILADRPEASDALELHHAHLMRESSRIGRQIASVEMTIRRLRNGEGLMAAEMFDGFSHEQYKSEVTVRWGAGGYESGDAWWRAKSATERAAFTDAQARIAAEFGAAASAGHAPGSDEVQAIVLRHVAWLSEVPGTPGYPNGPDPDYVAGLGELYGSDSRFAAVYAAHGPSTVELVRDALTVYAERNRR